MKKTLLFLSLVLSNPIFADEHDHHATEDKIIVIEVIDGAKVYGNKWNADFDSMNIEKALGEHEMLIGEEMIFTGNITKVCQKRGCWMMLETNGKIARVDFNHHSFFIPKDTQGTAEVFGKLRSRAMSDETKKHLEAEGAGKITQQIFEIIATSIKIRS